MKIHTLKPYTKFFSIRIAHGLQYRSAAISGVSTQLAWGFMYIMLYHAFIASNPHASPLSLSQLTSYVWLQQLCLSLFRSWGVDKKILNDISDGNISYELLRPVNIYGMWFTKDISQRISDFILRSLPLLLIVSFLPSPYSFVYPTDIRVYILFLISTILSLILLVSLDMLLYTTAIHTISSKGIVVIFVMGIDLLAGGLIPIPFFPENFQNILYKTPFPYIQNLPYRIFIGNITIGESLSKVSIQFIWVLIFIILGSIWMKRSIKHVAIQGG